MSDFKRKITTWATLAPNPQNTFIHTEKGMADGVGLFQKKKSGHVEALSPNSESTLTQNCLLAGAPD